MAFATDDRVRDVTTTTGTGAVTVSGVAPISYQTFSAALTVGDTFLGLIAHQSANEWEVGLYTYSSSNTVTRTTILASSNAGSAVSFSAGVKDVVLQQNAKRQLLATDLTVPVIYGGKEVNSSLILQSTSGAGSTDNVTVRTGNSAIDGLQVNTSQNILLKNFENITSDWLSWTPTFTADAGTFTTATANSMKYWRCGHFMLVVGEVGISNVGSATGGAIIISMPSGIFMAAQSVGPAWNRATGGHGTAFCQGEDGSNKIKIIIGDQAPLVSGMTWDFTIGLRI
jgi:hypothetical protein